MKRCYHSVILLAAALVGSVGLASETKVIINLSDQRAASLNRVESHPCSTPAFVRRENGAQLAPWSGLLPAVGSIHEPVKRLNLPSFPRDT